MRILILFLLTTIYASLPAQHITYVKSIIDTLASPYFSGRGAVNEGEKKAAEYIAKEFKRNGLKMYNDSYFQEFNYSINTFPNKIELKVGSQRLTPGVDFIVGAASGETAGTFDLVWYNKDNIPTKKQIKKLVSRRFFSKKFIVIDDEGDTENKELFDLMKLNVLGAAGIVTLEDKLTQSLARTYNEFAVLHIKKGTISRTDRSLTVTINQKLISKYQSQNVIGFVEGVEQPDSVVVLSAHYDHLGMMGKGVYFPGANDNASGIAMLLNLVYHYTHKEPPKKTIVFIAFGAEEAGLIGSKYFVEKPTVPLSKINFVMNMDLMGTGDEGAMIVNAKVYPKHFEKLNNINTANKYVIELKQRGKAANSDHYWFSENGVPAFFIYTLGGIKAYHDVDDVAKTLPLTDFEDCFRLIRDFVDDL